MKNAVNRFGKKNWMGVFAVPWAVINDTALLASLPDRDFAAGLSEVVKVAVLKSPGEFQWLCENAAGISARDLRAVLPAIRISAELHRAHITRGGDPFEALEARPLDYGHWSAHRLEAMTNFEIRHGEAVAIGMAFAAERSETLGLSPRGTADRLVALLRRAGLPTELPEFPRRAYLQALRVDKKKREAKIRFVALRGIGRAETVPLLPREIIPPTRAKARR